jgi:glutathione S-transferase
LTLILPISLVHSFTVVEILFITVAIIGIRVVLVFHKLGQRGKDKRIILESLTVSHYVEKIRWCLDYLNISYEEEENSGILGLFTLGRTVPVLKIPGNAISIGNSPEILRYLYGEHCCEKEKEDFLQPTLERLELEKKFDKLGFNYRAFAYYVIFNSPNVDSWEKEVWGLFQPGVPEWQKFILKLCSPFFRKLVTMKLNITEENGMKRLKEARQTIEEIDEILSDGRKTLMATTEPTYLDFHFCAMVAIILRPPEYGGGIINKLTFDPDQKDIPQKMKEEKEYLMKTRSGKFVMNMYNEYRNRKLSQRILW